MEMKYNHKVIDDLFSYYINQVFKMLGIFEANDANGYRFAIRIHSELEHLPYQFEELNDDYRFNIVLTKIETIIEELYYLDGEHQFVKNHVMETINLLEKIKEGLK